MFKKFEYEIGDVNVCIVIFWDIKEFFVCGWILEEMKICFWRDICVI